MRALIKAYPDALKEEDRFQRRPLTYAVQEKEAAFLPFLEADMPLSLNGGAPVDHGGTWTTCVVAESAAGAIRHILAPKDDDPLGGGFGVHIHALADVLDQQGRTALELAAWEPRQAINKYLLFCGRYELTLGAPEHHSATSVVLRATDRSEKTNYVAIFDHRRTRTRAASSEGRRSRQWRRASAWMSSSSLTSLVESLLTARASLVSAGGCWATACARS